LRVEMCIIYLDNNIMEIQSKKHFQHKQLITNQLISIATENAKNLGWLVEKRNNKVLVLKKHIDQLTSKDQNTEKLIDHILNIKVN
jgi:hypothetical protein